MLGFIIGLFIGGFIGVCLMALLQCAKQADREYEKVADEWRLDEQDDGPRT